MSIGTDVIYCNEYDSFVVQLGAAVARGDVVYVHTDSKGYPACAATGPTNKQPGIGIAEVAGAIGDWINVKHSGKVSVTGLTPGLIYLSDTPGKISLTAGTNPQIIGVAVKANEWVLDFDLKYGAAGADAYYKPDAGIPKTDLTAAVQASLDAADAAMPKAGGVFTGGVGFYSAPAVAQPADAAQTTVVPGNANDEIANLTFTALGPTQAECEALRDKCEELGDDVRALAMLANRLRADLVTLGLIKGSA